MPYKQIQKKHIQLKNTKIKDLQKKKDFSISFPGLFVGTIIGLITLLLSFIFGVIIGRGYNPEEQLKKISQLLPKTKAVASSEETILRPEDLMFMVELKQEVKLKPNEHSEIKEKTKNNEISSQDNKEISKDNNRIEPQKDILKTQNKESIKENLTSKENHLKKDTIIYDFVFQVASFKKAEQADILREKLEEKGVRTQLVIVKNNKNIPTWYQIRVLLRGIETDANTIKDILTSLNLLDARCILKEPTGKHR